MIPNRTVPFGIIFAIFAEYEWKIEDRGAEIYLVGLVFDTGIHDGKRGGQCAEREFQCA